MAQAMLVRSHLSSSSSSSCPCSHINQLLPRAGIPSLSRPPTRLLLSRRTASQWTRLTAVCRSNARITCLGDSKEDAARKALEQALGEKKKMFKKWDEEIKIRESTDDGSSGGGWSGNGDGGDSSDGEDSWEEAKQVFLSVTGLILLYLLITMGKGLFAFVLNMLLYALRGFRYQRPQIASNLSEGPGSAAAHVTDRWGRD